MSLCDRCWSPGACCKRMRLDSGGVVVTVWLDEDVDAQVEALGIPFQVAGMAGEWTAEDGRPYGEPVFTCDKLGPDGRCSIYDERPDVCRDYEPRRDGLCVHFLLESGDASAEFGVQ